jgi:hypothetical protein
MLIALNVTPRSRANAAAIEPPRPRDRAARARNSKLSAGRPPAAQPQVTLGACLVTTTKIHTKTMQFEVDAAALAWGRVECPRGDLNPHSP